MTEAYVCKVYPKAERPGVEPATFESWVYSFIHIRLLVQQLTKRNFAIELKQNETVPGLKRKLM